MMEPSDSQECKDFVKASYELSEKFDIPMMVRMTTRVCHAKGLVELEDRQEFETVKYVRNPQKYAMLPANARRRHVIREDLLKQMEEYSNDCPFNRVEKNGSKVGIITSGISYQHAKEVFGDTADYLKIGLSYPLPRKFMAEFGKNYETLYVIAMRISSALSAYSAGMSASVYLLSSKLAFSASRWLTTKSMGVSSLAA